MLFGRDGEGSGGAKRGRLSEREKHLYVRRETEELAGWGEEGRGGYDGGTEINGEGG